MIIDTHVHLWKKQNGEQFGKKVFSLDNGKSNFCGEIRQMMPPYMTDGFNSAEMLVANMDYALVSGAVVTQEVMDGNQNAYLKEVKAKYPDRFKICSLYDEEGATETEGFDGIKLCACKFKERNLLLHENAFDLAKQTGKFIFIELEDGAAQTDALEKLVKLYPTVKTVIGHFGMVTRPNWTEQIKLARLDNVFVESGGITWLFNEEFYPYPSAVKAIKEAASVCGQDKLMWGSDYPRTMVEITYKMSYDFILKSDLTDDFKEKFLFKNAKEFFGFQNLPTITPVKHML